MHIKFVNNKYYQCNTKNMLRLEGQEAVPIIYRKYLTKI